MLRVKFLVAVTLSIFLQLAISSVTFAQSNIQVDRPLDGATVREVVNILVPVDSVPNDGFVSYSIDGRFRLASSEKTNDESHYIYRWDTKQLDPDTNAPMEVRQPRDGRRTITVQAYDKNGRSVGESREIAVFVKNNASADMPAQGLRLAYRYTPNTSNDYKFTTMIRVNSIAGDTTIANEDRGIISGKEGVIKRTIEDLVRNNAAMIRQRLIGNIYDLQGGQSMPDYSFNSKSSYRIENSQGMLEEIITTSSPGTSISIDMPKLPAERVRIGDSWTLKQKIFRDPTSDQNAAFTTINMLEGLEWEGGFPCAKIKTTFTGTVKIPDYNIEDDTVSISGETITFFAYKRGKLVLSTTTAIAEATIPSGLASTLTSNAPRSSGSTPSGVMSGMPGMMPGGMPGGMVPPMTGGMPGGMVPPMTGGMPGGMVPPMTGGMPGGMVPPMTGGMPGGMVPPMTGGMPGGMMPGMASMEGGISSQSQEVDIKLEITNKLQLVK